MCVTLGTVFLITLKAQTSAPSGARMHTHYLGWLCQAWMVSYSINSRVFGLNAY